MRLTPAQINIIRNATRQNFGQDALIWLFGSRVDDSKRGGDVDLYIETSHRDTLMPTLRCKDADKLTQFFVETFKATPELFDYFQRLLKFCADAYGVKPL